MSAGMKTRLPMLAFLIAAPLAACATAPVPPPVAMAAATPTAHACPKHPEAVSDKPAVCPKCGMKMMSKQPASEQPIQPSPQPSPQPEGHH